MTRERPEGEEQPHIRIGFLRLRLPLVHYRFTGVEFLAGIVCTFILFAIVPILTDVLGMSKPMAYAVIVIQMWLYLLHAHFGDPVVSGWVTPCIPLVVAFLLEFPAGVERVYALLSLQIWFTAFLFGLGLTGLARPLVEKLPQTLKAGIILGAGIAGYLDVFYHTEVSWNYTHSPIGILGGSILACGLVWSYPLLVRREKYKVISTLQQYGLPIGFFSAVVLGLIFREIPFPTISWGLLPLDFKGLIEGYTVVGIGFPPWVTMVYALPLAFIIYITAYGDIVFGQEVIKSYQRNRPDEKVDLNPNRIHFITGIRNLVSVLAAPTPAMAGPLWTSMTAIIADRWSKGKKYMYSIWDGYNTFAVTLAILCFFGPIVTVFSTGFGNALAVGLVMQGFVSSFVALGMVQYVQQRGVAIIMAIVLATVGAWQALLIGGVMYLLMEFRLRKEDRLPEPEVEMLMEA
jgi:hypothetical protein